MIKFLFIISATLFTSGSLSQSTNIKCKSIFGRIASGSGTNTYYFSCNCMNTEPNNLLSAKCENSGPSINNQCKSEVVSSPSGKSSIHIHNCNLSNATVAIKKSDYST